MHSHANSLYAGMQTFPTFPEKVRSLGAICGAIDCHLLSIRGCRLKCDDELKNGPEECHMLWLMRR